MTGTRNMSALPLVEYFTPLVDWLKEQNNGENIGWSESCPTNIPLPTTNNVPPFVSSFGCFLILASILIDLLQQKSKPDTEIDVHPLSWLDTDTSRKSGGVKLLLWAHTSPLRELMQSCKCFLHMSKRGIFFFHFINLYCNECLELIMKLY
jgi:hypothetical protein